jgi:hypothetical protein
MIIPSLISLEAIGSFVFNEGLYELILILECFLLSFSVYCFANKPRIKRVFLVFCIYYIYIFFSEILFQSVPPWLPTIELIVFTWFATYEFYSVVEVKSSYNSKNICLAFYRPKKMGQYFLSLFGRPVSSFGIICDGYIYQMVYGKSTLQKRVWNKDEQNHYVIINTKQKVSKKHREELEKTLKFRARTIETFGLRLNCLRAFKKFLKTMPKKWHYRSEVLPSLYLSRILNEDEGEC